MNSKILLAFLACCSLTACQSAPRHVPKATKDTIAFPTASTDARREIVSREWLLKNVTVIDGTGAPALSGQDIHIVDGKIAGIRPTTDTTGIPVLDGTGLTVLPGMIDCHVHTESVPGAALRGDDMDLVREQQLLQLRAYVASGITSVLDTAISRPALLRLRKAVAEGAPGPSIYALSPFLTPKDGYFGTAAIRGPIMKDLDPPIESTGAIAKLFDGARDLQPSGVKVTVEDGMVFPIYPLFSSEQLTVIREEAGKAGAPIFVHSMTNAEHRIALQLKPYAFVHAGLANETIDPEVLQEMKQSGAYVISTIGVYEMERWFWDPPSIRQAWIEARVPQAQWQTANHPDARDLGLDMMTPLVKPHWAPTWVARRAATLFRDGESGRAEVDSSIRAVRAMYEAGIPIVMGADAGNWPVFTTFFHGVGSLLEMEMLERAGLPRSEVIVAATSRPAKMLKQEHHVGVIQPGMDADLVIVAKNPLEHGMAALHDIEWVVKGGVARTPAAWLHGD